MKIFFFIIALTVSAFCQDWYEMGVGYEKCRVENRFLICREDYVNDFCYGKERVWTNNGRGRVWYHLGEEREWFNRKLLAVRNLNSKCEYNGWSRFLTADGKWVWQCYRNNREMSDADCKGYLKR
jgi:hypothetical protein